MCGVGSISAAPSVPPFISRTAAGNRAYVWGGTKKSVHDNEVLKRGREKGNRAPLARRARDSHRLGARTKWVSGSSALNLSTHVVIGQFSGPYFTVRPAKIESCSFPARPINLRDISKYLTNLVFSVRTVSYESSFFPVEKTRSVTYSTDLELG